MINLRMHGVGAMKVKHKLQLEIKLFYFRRILFLTNGGRAAETAPITRVVTGKL